MAKSFDEADFLLEMPKRTRQFLEELQGRYRLAGFGRNENFIMKVCWDKALSGLRRLLNDNPNASLPKNADKILDSVYKHQPGEGPIPRKWHGPEKEVEESIAARIPRKRSNTQK